jgi:hypothetical protein
MLTNTVLAGKVDSMEDFKSACEEMNEKERKGRKEEEEKEGEEGREEGREYRKGKQPMCCKSNNSLLRPTLDRVLSRSALDNMCTDLEG